MAWDRNRPYAPFCNEDMYWQCRDSMDSYGNGETITEEKIDAMYVDGVYVPQMEKYLMAQLDKNRISKDLGYLYRHGRARQLCS